MVETVSYLDNVTLRSTASGQGSVITGGSRDDVVLCLISAYGSTGLPAKHLPGAACLALRFPSIFP